MLLPTNERFYIVDLNDKQNNGKVLLINSGARGISKTN